MRLVSATKAFFAAIAGIIITFSQSHAALLGLQVAAGYALALGAALLALTALFARKLFLANLAEALLLLIFGAFALLLTAASAEQTPVLLTWLISSLTISMGLISLWQSFQLGMRTKQARDPQLTAGLNFGLAALFLIAPLDQVALVGLFGAYLVLLAVHLGISAASPNTDKSAS